MENCLRKVLDQVFAAYSDWGQMLKKVDSVGDSLKKMTKAFSVDEIEEALDFVDWLKARNFVFLGAADYDYFDSSGKEKLSTIKDSELGIMRIGLAELMHKGLEQLPPEARHFATEPGLVQVMKANKKSLVHRRVYMDIIRIKKCDAAGKVIGETRFVGLFTSTVYYQATDDIPFIRQKVRAVFDQANFDPASHDGKSLKTILEFFPRDEIFQISGEELFDMALGLMSLEARPDVRVFARKDRFERYISCLVYTPRDKFSTFVRKEIEKILERELHGKVSSFYTQLTDSPLARLHLIIKTTPGEIPDYDISAAEQIIRDVVNYWIDGLREELHEKFGEEKGESYYRQFHNAFPKAYVNTYPIPSGIEDILIIHDAIKSNEPRFNLVTTGKKSTHLRLKFYSIEESPALSEIFPVLENLGFRVIDVVPYTLTPILDYPINVSLRDFEIRPEDESQLDVPTVKPIIEEALLKVWLREMENDRYNALVAKASLSWREVTLLRAYGKYLKQTGLAFNETYVAGSLTRYPSIARKLVEYFETRFNPAAKHRAEAMEALQSSIQSELAGVSNLADDRILRRFNDTMTATLRTNFYQHDAEQKPKSYISFKLDSENVPELPLPRPHAEIFVYSTRTEGIHLRGGKVARGGLRWSDRPEDFRTEILGLMKAQMVKNAVIVPVGSKGGFVVKQPPKDAGRDAMLQEGISCYKEFLSGLLDITDNIINHKIVPPKDTVRHDKDDPYLVVAADKGTATFSDIANGVSADYQFWLDDAFASGGSAGYDHKEMAITARGAWVSVERHFRELGMDISKNDFTTVGIGDMSGDVFGNGMLLSDHIKLVGAFNHLHIFLDPNPDAKKSFKERRRLYDLPRSSWADYKADLISKGGGIYERSAKSIPLSAEMRKVLGTEKKSAAPDEVIRMLLMAEVDLLWNGGIGTYVKGDEESNESVGDTANNAVRINASELRAKVVAEGGNLGFTQRGRIGYARKGGKINTDSIDNSAGVDCSDHEVNIKIALSPLLQNNALTRKKRDELLKQMTDEVAALVLRDNQYQTQAITIAERQGYALLEPCVRLMKGLERIGMLDRVVEKLPLDKDLQTLRAERKGLSRPELSILLSYAKLWLNQEISQSKLVTNDYFISDLLRYFPEPMQKKFAEAIASHRLRKEIIATVITNSIVNRTGITFVHSIMEDTGFAPSEIASAYIAARDAFVLRNIWREIEALDGKIDVNIQVQLFQDVNRFIEQVTRWFLQNVSHPMDITAAIGEFAPHIKTYVECYQDVLSESAKRAYSKRFDLFKEAHVPVALAERVASLEAMGNACDIIRVALQTKQPVKTVAALYYEIGSRLQLGWLRGAIGKMTFETHWDRLAAKSLVDELMREQYRLTLTVLKSSKKADKDFAQLDGWMQAHNDSIERLRQLLHDVKSTDKRDLPMMVIALKALGAVT
ncbi:MAG: NAD-glutamate dehydrogenase [Rickettsiales bacterium]